MLLTLQMINCAASIFIELEHSEILASVRRKSSHVFLSCRLYFRKNKARSAELDDKKLLTRSLIYENLSGIHRSPSESFHVKALIYSFLHAIVRSHDVIRISIKDRHLPLLNTSSVTQTRNSIKIFENSDT